MAQHLDNLWQPFNGLQQPSGGLQQHYSGLQQPYSGQQPPSYGFYQPQPTNVASMFSSMSLLPHAQDPNYYMDSGASSHMTFNQGNITSLTP